MILFRLRNVLFIIVLLSLIISCENDLEEVNTKFNPNVVPELTGTNVEILYSDSAKLKVRIVTTKLLRFRKSDNKPYIEFPEGMHVYFYDDSMAVNAEVSSRYAIYQETIKLWKATNDVVVVNVKGEKLNTELLFWDENKEIIYSTKYCKVTTPEGEVHEGHKGLTARQDFSNYKLLGASGSMKLRDETD